MQASQQQEMTQLRAARAQFAKEKETLTDQVADWNAKIARKKDIIAQLEQTVAELQKPDGRRTGLLRCAAEYGRPSPEAGGAGPQGRKEAAPRSLGPSSEELALGCRIADAVARGPNAELTFGWSREDYDKEFAVEEGSQMQRFFGSLSCEQRLVWEIQNPPEHSLKADRQLLDELKKAGRRHEVDLLVTAAGPPSDREREYRPLLWLQHNRDLNASYVERSVMSTSLLMLACQAGYGDTARELIARKADVHHVNQENSSALLAACRRRSLDCVRLLLESQANPNETVGGTSLLAWAAGLPDLRQEQPTEGASPSPASEPLVPLLLEFSAAPDARDARGRTALMHAAGRGKRGACEALLAARADPGVQDSDGKTAIELAIEGQHFGISDWLDTLA